MLLFTVMILTSFMKKYRRSTFLAIFIVLTLFAGLRARYVGTDSITYINTFENVDDIDDISKRNKEIEIFEDNYSLSSLFSEPAYTLLCLFTKVWSDNYPLLFIFIACIVVGGYLNSIAVNSVSVPLSIFIFLTMGLYFSFFNIARQGMACAVYALGYSSLINKNFSKYCFWVLIAALFHRTALIGIPLYFVFARQNDLKENILIFGIGVFCALFFDSFTAYLSENISKKYSVYIDYELTSGYFYALFYMCLGIGFLFCKRFICAEDRPQYDVWLNMILLAGVICLAILYSELEQNAMRLSYYFLFPVCFEWPILFRNIKNNKFSRFLLFCFSLLSIIMYYLIVRRNGMMYYSFNEWIS